MVLACFDPWWPNFKIGLRSRRGGYLVGRTWMADYRVYLVGRDGRTISQTPSICADDAEAIKQAQHFVGGDAIELWNGDRLVKRLEAKTK